MVAPSIRPTLISAPQAALFPLDGNTPCEMLESSLAEQRKTDECRQLVDTHLYLVRLIARQLFARIPKHIGFDELIAAGNLGLVHAAARFKAGQAIQFQSFAQFRIRGAMLDLLRGMDWSPRSLRRQGRALEQSRRSLMARGEQNPSDADIATDMGMTLESYNQLVYELYSLEIRSLSESSFDKAPKEDVANVISPDADNPLFRCLQGETKEFVIAAINLLPERERIVLSLYYYEELTMKEIAEVLRISDSRVSQLHSTAVLRLRSLLDQQQ